MLDTLEAERLKAPLAKPPGGGLVYAIMLRRVEAEGWPQSVDMMAADCRLNRDDIKSKLDRIGTCKKTARWHTSNLQCRLLVYPISSCCTAKQFLEF